MYNYFYFRDKDEGRISDLLKVMSLARIESGSLKINSTPVMCKAICLFI